MVSNLLESLIGLIPPFCHRVFQQTTLILKNLEKNCTESGDKSFLLVIFFEEEVTHSMRSRGLQLCVDQSFSKCALPSTWIGTDPQKLPLRAFMPTLEPRII